MSKLQLNLQPATNYAQNIMADMEAQQRSTFNAINAANRERARNEAEKREFKNNCREFGRNSCIFKGNKCYS